MSALSFERVVRGSGGLVLLFVLGLAVFTAARWHPGPWLDSRVNGLARQAGIGLQYRSLGIHGLALRVDGASLALPGAAAPVRVDRLTVRPAWLGFLTGHSGAQISLLLHGQALHFSVVLHGHEAIVHIPDTRFPASALDPLWQQAMALPAVLAGEIRMHGDTSVALADGRPLHGHVELVWTHAGADVIGNRLALGSYRIQGNGKDGHWRFTAAGGKQAVLKASASLDATASDARVWALQAQGMLSAMPGSVVAGLLGAKPMRFSLSGPIHAPRWRVGS